MLKYKAFKLHCNRCGWEQFSYEPVGTTQIPCQRCLAPTEEIISFQRADMQEANQWEIFKEEE